MAVSYDNSLTAKVAGSSPGTNAWTSGNLSVGSLTNACGILILGWDNTSGTARTVSTVKLDSTGSAFTRLNGITGSWGAGRGEAGIDIWYLAGSAFTNANHTCDVVMSGNTRWKAGLFLTAQGVDQTTPMSGFVSNNSDLTTPSALSPTGGTANDLLISARLQFDGAGSATMGASTNTTQRGTTQTDTAIFGLEYIGGTAPGNASTIGYTWTGSPLNTIEIAAVIKAVAAGGVVVPWPLLLGQRVL